MSESFLSELRQQRRQALRILREAAFREDDGMVEAMRSRLEELAHLAASNGAQVLSAR